MDSHDTASAVHHCALGFTRPRETGVSGKGELGERGGVLNICIKGKNKTKFTGWGGAIFICCK